jgi:hypothetical protein
MPRRAIVLSVTLLLLALSLSLAQRRFRSAIHQDSGTSGPTPVASDSGASQPSEGCKLGIYTGTTPLSHLPYYVAGEEDLRGGMTCAFRIHSKLPLFTFHFAGREDNTLGNLEITSSTSSEVIQTIENSTDPAAIEPATATSVLTAVDANFDGYQDLQLLSTCGGTGNCSYNFYLYDPKTKQFVHNDFLSGLMTPSFDQAKKQVMTGSNLSAYDSKGETYQYENGRQYTLIQRQVSIWDRNGHTVTVRTYELRNGRMELIDSTTKPE